MRREGGSFDVFHLHLATKQRKNKLKLLLNSDRGGDRIKEGRGESRLGVYEVIYQTCVFNISSHFNFSALFYSNYFHPRVCACADTVHIATQAEPSCLNP